MGTVGLVAADYRVGSFPATNHGAGRIVRKIGYVAWPVATGRVERHRDPARCERAPLRDYETLDVATNGDTALGRECSANGLFGGAHHKRECRNNGSMLFGVLSRPGSVV